MHDRPVRPLPIADELHFQKTSWIIQRIGWAVLVAVVLAALLGVFSHGYVSRAVASRPDAQLTVEYERFQRASLLTRLTVTLAPGAHDEARLRFGPVFQDLYEIEAVEPRPARSSASGKGLDLYFDAPEREDVHVVFWARPRRTGLFALSAANAEGSELPFRVFVYP